MGRVRLMRYPGGALALETGLYLAGALACPSRPERRSAVDPAAGNEITIAIRASAVGEETVG